MAAVGILLLLVFALAASVIGSAGIFPDVDLRQCFDSVDSDKSGSLDKHEFRELVALYLTKYSVHSVFESTTNSANGNKSGTPPVVTKAFQHCDVDSDLRISWYELGRCADYHYLYNNWIETSNSNVNLWPPRLKVVPRFDAQDLAQRVTGLQHFRRHGYAVFKVLSPAEASEAEASWF